MLSCSGGLQVAGAPGVSVRCAFCHFYLLLRRIPCLRVELVLGGLNCFVVQRRGRAQGPLAMAMVPPTDIDTTSFVLGVLGTGAVSFGVFRAVVYFNVQVRSPELCRLYASRIRITFSCVVKRTA